jgi:hypothetical protein
MASPAIPFRVTPNFGTFGLATRFASAHQSFASRGRQTIQFFAKCQKSALKMRRGIASSERPHMPSRKFGIGEMVALKASVSRNVPGEVYEAIRLLPHNGA